VVIAHDVDPIEIVLWLPTLCRKKGVPYVIIKGKARLGKLVHKKNASCIAVTEIDSGKDAHDLQIFTEKALNNFNHQLTETMQSARSGIMGAKHYARKKKEEKRRRSEQRKKKQK
jgi:large subunit ribosomal protein L7Ae